VKYEGGTREILANRTLSDVIRRNLEQLNDLEYTDDELVFAARLQESLDQQVGLQSIRMVENVDGTTGRGSTDVGDVSWNVPTSGFTTACWVPGTAGHSWQAVACGGTTIAEKGMNLAARTLAAATCELMLDESKLAAARAELQQRLAGQSYQSLMKPGQSPPLDYRVSPQSR